MNQSNVLMGALFVAFVIFITMRGKTKKYLDLLVGGGTSATAASDKAASSSSSGGGSGGDAPASGGAGGALGAIGSALGIPSSVTGALGGLFGGSGGSSGGGPTSAPATDAGSGSSVPLPFTGGNVLTPFSDLMIRGAGNMLGSASTGADYLTGGALGSASRLVKSGGDAAVGFFQSIPSYIPEPSMPSFVSSMYGSGGEMYYGGGALYDATQPPGGMFSTSQFANPFFGGGAP